MPRLAIYAAGMPFNGATIKDGKSLGGSESAAYYTSKEMAKLGWDVIVFTTSEETGKFDGVDYEYIGERTNETPFGDRFEYMMHVPHDVVVMQRIPTGFIKPVNSKCNIFWLHDLALARNAPAFSTSFINTDRVFAVSEWHRQQVMKVLDVGDKFVKATMNGVDYEQVKEATKTVQSREPKSLFFMARPERGLENLVDVGGIMEMLPDFHLYVSTYDNFTEEMRGYYEYLNQRCDLLPNVTRLGCLGKDDLYRKLSQVELMVYPTNFEDTSCIAVLEANACGTPVIGSDHSAVPETIGDGGAVLLKLKNGEVDRKRFADMVKKVCNEKNTWKDLHEKALAKRQPWSGVALQWDAEFRTMLAEKSANGVNLAKHLERHSDIIALRSAGLEIHLPNFERDYGFLLSGDFAGHYAKYYQYEKDRGVNYGPEDLSGQERYEATCMQIMRKLGLKAGDDPKRATGRILDYGCAHGHYTINLAKRLPNVTFVGVDISESNIKIAEEWAKTDKVENVTFVNATSDNMPDVEPFDIVLACEVLEHVERPQAVVEKLIPFVKPGGKMMISVPFGAWEAIGYDQNIGWRAHLHHFERDDLKEIFGAQGDFSLLVLPAIVPSDKFQNLGHYFVTFTPNGEPLGEIDYALKLKMQAPEQSLSVCMIAHNEEDAIGGALKSVGSIADEIIVGIDRRTTDGTEAVCLKHGAKVIYIDSPVEQGFDEARNKTIAEASCDWILWIDADEKIEFQETLKKYLRPNCYDGYAIKQHHYAVEPAQLFKTDFPVRLFRNNIGIRFFGVVHEHPEKKLNDGVGKVCVLPEPAIMHVGYSTEAVRRKRFERNWPLMQRDHIKHPKRILGRFLWLRDLAHLIRYTMEANGNHVTPQVRGWANEAVETWQSLLADREMRYVEEGLQYYSQAVAVLTGNRGVDFAVNMELSKGNGGVQLGNNPVAGKFLNYDDAKLMTVAIIEEKNKKYENKYF